MIDYTPLLSALTEINAGAWADLIPEQIQTAFDLTRHGNLATWQELTNSITASTAEKRLLDQDCVQIGTAQDLSESERDLLKTQLKTLHPWRKGPFEIFGIKIDTEWRSDWKWQRLAPYISPLKYRSILDVGCGNGYYGWRMLGAQAKLVVGIDPTLLSVVQFSCIRKLYGGEPPIYVLPLGIEHLPYGLKAFDTVFSMGVFYHRRSPIDHLIELRDCLIPGGELVLETLVIDGELGKVLLPDDRYAQMRNVWFIPSCLTLESWLKRCGFKNIRLVDVSTTSIDEQRSTEWMTFHSLKNFLNPLDPAYTMEGLPAPQRAIFIAESPNAIKS